MPGVSVTTNIRQGASGEDIVPSSTFFVAGTAPRGPADEAVMILSTADFEKVYGKYDAATTLHAAVRTFFAEGGTRCYVARAVDGGDEATVTLVNGSDNFVVVTSVGVGTSYEDIDIVVADGYGADTVRISVVDDGTVVWRSGDLATCAAIVSALNANVGYLVTATLGGDAGDGTGVGDANLPSFLTFTLGGTAADSDAVDADAIADAIDDLFGADFGPGAVAAPGVPYDAQPDDDEDVVIFGERLLAHCAANRRIALLAPENTTDADDLKGDVPDWYGKENAEYGAIYFPWVQIPDGLGGTIEVSPEAYVAGARARAHTHTGPWKPGAGEVASSQYVTGLYLPPGQSWTRADADELDGYQVNTIRVVNGSIRVYGANTLSGDVTNWRFITYRDTVNAIVGLIEVALEPYVFAPIDSRGGVFGQIDASIRALLASFAAAGGLYARTVDDEEVDPGYTVLVDSVNNPASQIAEGRISAEVGLRVSPIGETINVTIYKSGLTTAI